jgi:hypothetical protein
MGSVWLQARRHCLVTCDRPIAVPSWTKRNAPMSQYIVALSSDVLGTNPELIDDCARESN